MVLDSKGNYDMINYDFKVKYEYCDNCNYKVKTTILKPRIRMRTCD